MAHWPGNKTKQQEEYRQLLAENSFEGLRIVDIIREGMTGDDPRLQ